MKASSLLDLYKLLASSAFIQTSGMVATTLIGIQLARYLGPAGYGVYGLIMAVVSLVTVASQFGLPQYAIREAAAATSDRDYSKLRGVVSWFLVRSAGFAITISSGAALAFFAFRPAALKGHSEAILYAAVATILFSTLGVLIGLVRGAGHNLNGQSVDVLARPLFIAIALFAVHQQSGSLTVDVAIVMQIAAALLAISYAIFLILKVHGKSEISQYVPVQWATVCLSFFSTAMLLAINGNYPMIVAGLFVGPNDLGIFRVALASAAIFGLPSSIANIAIGPLIARLHRQGDAAAMADALSHTTIVTFTSTAIGMLILFGVGRPLLAFLFGAQFVPAYVPLLLLGTTQLVSSAFGTSATYLNMTGKERLVVRAFVMAVPIGLIASIPLTTRFGINGAALGSLITVSLWHWYILVLNRRQITAPLSLLSAVRHMRGRRRFRVETDPLIPSS